MKWAKTIAVSLMVLGAVLRIARYADNRCLWLDEVLLANNLLHRSFAELLRPLDYRQGAPIGFLWLCKASITALGQSERALRLIPLMSGLASLPLFYFVAHRTLRPATALIALATFGVLEPLVYYSSELKPYSTDVALSLAVLLAMFRYREQPHNGRFAALLGIGLAAIFLSYPAVFLLFGGAAALMMDRRLRKSLALCAGAWLAALAANYALFLRSLADEQSLHEYWAGGFMPHSWNAAPWLYNAYVAVFSGCETMWLKFPLICATAALIGLSWLWLRDRSALAILLIPLALALLASALRAYPFSGRLIVFTVPLFVLLMGAAIEPLWTGLRFPLRLAAPALAAILLLPAAGRAALYLIHPPGREEIKPVLAYLAPRLRTADLLYIYHAADAAFLYYRDEVGVPPRPFIHGRRPSDDATAFASDIEQLRHHPRVWLLFSHVWLTPHGDEQQQMLNMLDSCGQRVENFHATGADLWLYDLSP